MTTQDLLDTLNRMLHDKLIRPDSVIIVRAVGSLSWGIEMAIEKPASRVVSAEPEPGRTIIKIIAV